jgi:hypothetical protein
LAFSGAIVRPAGRRNPNITAMHSIFARQWWVLALRTTRGAKGGSPISRLREFAGEIADAVDGSLLKTPGIARPGVFISATAEEGDSGSPPAAVKSMLHLQTDRVYFPLAEEDLETGVADSDRSVDERDFPRRLVSSSRVVFQYPLFTGFAQKHVIGGVYIIASPYFMLLKDVMRELERGNSYTHCIGVEVTEVFAHLNDVSLRNGTVTVRAGRMLITGIPFIRSAVFFGDNVIASPLYLDLIKLQQKSDHDVKIDPKDCRLQRSYEEPVGGNRRAHVCWFDVHGNFRFTPGTNGSATLDKFLELLTVLDELNLVRNADTRNPLARIGVRTSTKP